MKYFGEKYLLNTYKDLYLEKEVKEAGNPGDSKYELVHKFLSKFKIFLKKSNIENLNIFKEELFSKNIIKIEDIPSKNHFGKSYTSKDIEGIISNQKESLNTWYYYLFNPQLDIPTWIRFFIFKSILSLGNFNPENNIFNRRSRKTINAFPVFNKESVDLVINHLIKLEENSNFTDHELRRIVSENSFNKLYASSLIRISSLSKSNQGIWKIYEDGDYLKLTSDIKNMIVPWCIKRNYEASEFLEVGSIKIFYTKDYNGNYTIPRLCIRKAKDKIVEVRGVKDGYQNVEDVMLPVLHDEIKDIDHNDIVYKTLLDMEKLSTIYKKYKNKEELTKEELIFIYEIKNIISCFGENFRDSRIDNIIKNRDYLKDISSILNINEEDIGVSKKDLSRDIKCYCGDIKTLDEEEFINIKIPNIVLGDIILCNLKTSEVLKDLEFVSGRLNLIGIEEIDNLNNLKFVRDSIVLSPLDNSDLLYNLALNNRVLISKDTETIKYFEYVKNKGIVRKRK